MSNLDNASSIKIEDLIKKFEHLGSPIFTELREKFIGVSDKFISILADKYFFEEDYLYLLKNFVSGDATDSIAMESMKADPEFENVLNDIILFKKFEIDFLNALSIEKKDAFIPFDMGNSELDNRQFVTFDMPDFQEEDSRELTTEIRKVYYPFGVKAVNDESKIMCFFDKTYSIYGPTEEFDQVNSFHR